MPNFFSKIYSNYKVEITGIISWVLFAFGAVKLWGVFLSKTFLPFLLPYNICSIIYLLYFTSYYKPDFGVKKFILLVISFNVGFYLLHFSYFWLVALERIEIPISSLIASFVINAVLCTIVYLIICAIIKNKKQ
jgi:hypothetical protein